MRLVPVRETGPGVFANLFLWRYRGVGLGWVRWPMVNGGSGAAAGWVDYLAAPPAMSISTDLHQPPALEVS